jgi:hypothetical protein
MEKRFVISEEFANKLLAYLAQRPYAEVFQLVQPLMALPPLDDTTPADLTLVAPKSEGQDC